jgi:hypothetical protein
VILPDGQAALAASTPQPRSAHRGGEASAAIRQGVPSLNGQADSWGRPVSVNQSHAPQMNPSDVGSRCKFTHCWVPPEGTKRRKGGGNTDAGALFPLGRVQLALECGGRNTGCRAGRSLDVLRCERLRYVEPGGALCRPCRSQRGCQQQRRRHLGRGFPTIFQAPFSLWSANLLAS